MGRRDEQSPLRSGRAWRGIGRPVAAALAIGLAGCGGGHSTPPVDAMGPPTWWQPKVGEAKNWDIQLSAPIDVSTPRLMYELDLWSLVPSQTTLDYGDGAPVMVKAGALAGTIAQLHARTPSTIVICHVETGALEMNRPDAAKFPPDVIGGDVPGLAMGRFLDVSMAGRAKWMSIMFKRFDLARQIGCDGVEPAHNDVGAFTGTGFTIKTEDSYSWYAEVAKQGHDRMLSTGMKNNNTLGAIDVEADNFDWLMIERCGEFMNCDVVKPFLDRSKAVFAIDYNFDSGDDSMVPPIPPMPQGSIGVCMQQGMASIADGLYKDVPLTSAVRTPCEP